MLFKLLLIACLTGVYSSGIFRQITSDDCSISKGCVRPPACPDNVCQFLVSWRQVSMDSVDYLEFELKGKLRKRNGFISLSFSKDKRVGNDGVVGCYYNPSSDSVRVRAAYSDEDGKSAMFYTGSDKPSIQWSSHKLPISSKDLIVDIGEGLGGDFNKDYNILQCRFRRRVLPLDVINQLMDLSVPNPYFLVVTRGDDVLSGGFDGPFPGGQSMTENPVVLSSPVLGSMTYATSVGHPLMKTHGCLMVLAWVFCASVGIILARYYKDLWPNSGLLGDLVWFQTHRILQATCVILTLIALILAIIFCKGYSAVAAYPYYVHPILGFIVICLAVLNPFIGLCRCDVNNRNRPWFNWIHFFVGTIAHVLSIPTMMLGLRMPAAGAQLTFVDYPLWILIFFVIFQFIIELTLEIHGCLYYQRNKEKRHAHQAALNRYQAGIRLGGIHQQQPVQPEPSGRLFKYFIIGLHTTVSAIVAVILVITIAVN